jgi:hypothetical protein
MRLFLIVFLFMAASSASGQEWSALPGMTSAKLAATGWEHRSATGLSWPDGRQAIVSFWTMQSSKIPRLTMRCVSYFDADFQQSGDICYQVGFLR